MIDPLEEKAIQQAVRRAKHQSYRVPARDRFALWGDPSRPGYKASPRGPKEQWEVRTRSTVLPKPVTYTIHGSWVVVVVVEDYFIRGNEVRRQVSGGTSYRAHPSHDLCGWCGAVNPYREVDGCCGNCGGN